MRRPLNALISILLAMALVPSDASAGRDVDDERVPLLTNIGPGADPMRPETLPLLDAPFGAPDALRGGTDAPAVSNALDGSDAVVSYDSRSTVLRKRRQVIEAKRTELSGELESAHEETVRRGRAYYRLTRAGMLPIAGGFDGFVRHAMRMSHARRLATRALTGERRLRHRRDRLSALLEKTDSQIEEIAKARSTAVAALEEEASTSRSEAAFERAFSASSGGTPFVSVDEPEPAIDSRGFARMRGRLLFPLVGSADVRAAKAIEGDGPGLEIVAKRGTPVRAIYAGRVAFADHYGEFGRIVIVDHGAHYYSVSGNLANVDVRVGDEVSGGERLGTIGVKNAESFLYFELRKESETIDARPWLGL